jgi:hypothetical protein
VTNAAVILEMMLAGGPLGHVATFDTGPTFAPLKRSVGLKPLDFRKTLRIAALG